MIQFNLFIADAARLDIIEAFDWYNEISSHLADSLETNIEASLNTIQHNPNLFQKRYKKIRIHFIKRFPYGIHYFLEGTTIRVIGFFHTSRDPKRWYDRRRSAPDFTA